MADIEELGTEKERLETEIYDRREELNRLIEESQKLREASVKKEEKHSKFLEDFPGNSSDSEEEVEKDQTTSRLRWQIPKLDKFKKGANFARFCERFEQYAHISKTKDTDLYIMLLNNVDNETYSVLKEVSLTKKEKRDAKKFCEVYKKAIYGDEVISLKADLMRCCQDEEEDIESYAFRLRDKANIAYTDRETGEENCLLVFLQNVRDKDMRRKLNEASFINFAEAIKQARRIEKARDLDKKLPVKSELTPILKQISFTEGQVEENNKGFQKRGESMSRESYRDNKERGFSRENGGSRYGQFNNRPEIICWFCNRPGHRQATCFRRFPNRNNIGGRNFSRVGPGIRGKNFGNGGTNRNFGNYAGGEMRSQDFGNGGFQNSNFGQQRLGQEQYYGRNFSQNGDVQRSDPSQQRLN